MPGADETIDVLVHLRDELSRAAAHVDRSIDDIKKSAAEATPAVEALGHAIDDTGDKSSKAAAKQEMLASANKKQARSAVEAAGANAVLSKTLDRQSARAGGKGWFGALTGSMKFGRFMKMALIPTILDAVSALSTLGGAAVAASVAGIGALSPLVGLLGVIPGAMTSVLQGFGVFKLATAGMGDALKQGMSAGGDPKKFAEAMKNLSPAARDFVKSIVAFKKPFEDLKTTVGKALLPSMTKLMGVFRGYMPLVKSSLTETARAMSGAVRGLSRYFALAETQKKVGTVLGNNTQLISRFGGIAKSGLATLLNIMIAASPILLRMADDVTRFMTKLEVGSGRGNGLTKFFESSYTVMRKVLKFTEDISMALFNIGKIGVPLGHEMGDSWLDMAKKFRRFTESSKGVEKIKNWFAQMRPVIYETGRLVADIGKAFAHWSMDPTVLDTLRSLRTDTLPNIVKLVDSAAGRFLPAIAKALGSILNIITNLFVLPSLLDIIANTLDSIATIIQSLPAPIKNILSMALTLTTLFKVSGTIGFFKGLVGGSVAASGSMGVLAKSTGVMKSTLGGLGFAFAAVRGGAATTTESLKYLAVGGMGAVKSAAVALSGVLKASLIIALIAVVGGMMAAGSAADEMEKKFSDARAEFAKTPNQDTWRTMADTINETIDAYNNYNSHNPLTAIGDMDVWKDTLTQIGNGWSAMWGGPHTDTIQERRAKQIKESQLQLRQYQHTVDWVSTQTKTSADLVREAMDKLGIDPAKWKYTDITKAVKEYVWMTYKADEATRTVGNALKTLASETAGTTEKIDAFSAALDALQPDQSFKDATSAAIKQIKELGTTMTDNKKFFKDGTTEITFSNRQVKRYGDSIHDLHEKLKGQVTTMDAVTTARFKETGSIDAAMAAYKKQYDTMKATVVKGYHDAGYSAKEADAKATALLSTYALTPEKMLTIFTQPGIAEALANGATLEEIIKNGIPKDKSITVTLTANGFTVVEQRLADLGSKLGAMDRRTRGALATGGPAFSGVDYTVGERGPEMWVGTNGRIKMIGVGGQENMTFPTDGYVIPNHALPTVTPIDAASGRTTTTEEYLPLPDVKVGPVYVNEPIDLERAVARGIAKADKDRRERGGGR